MKEYFADFHIHIGWTEQRQPVKITASKDLTFFNIFQEAYHHKGLDIIGIIDTHSPNVQREIEKYLNEGILVELKDGGLQYKGLTILLGAEVEVKEQGRGPAHFLVYLPYYKDMVDFTEWLKQHMKNPNLSSQRLYASTRELQLEVKKRNGLFIPAHIFTPHKSVYGNCCDKMDEIMDISLIDAVELGLSSDSDMADTIEELNNLPYLTNSDAHSLQKIGREYNKLLLAEPTFAEVVKALKMIDNRRILVNYGLNPRLGKYHNSRCLDCNNITEDTECKYCGSRKIVKGVKNRIDEIASYSEGHHPTNRPPYIHQVPLEFLPKVGKKTLEKLLMHFGTEMNILHKASEDDLKGVISAEIAEMIILAREGRLGVENGGGGIYGKVLK